MVGRKALVSGLALLSLVACGDGTRGASTEPLATTAAAITGGTDDANDEAVVMLGQVGQTICTGTVIAPTVVATAAHCLVFPPTAVHVSTGAGPSRTIGVAAVHRHPLYDGQSFAHDVGVLVLTEPANIPAVLLHEGGLTDALRGQAVRIVGFGVSDTAKGTTGAKMQGTSVVQDLEPDVIKITPSPAQPCRGDSGGPVLVRDGDVERLVGITSRGDGTCSTYARAMRMDLYRAFFVAQIDAAAPADDGSRGCSARRASPGSSAGSAALVLFAACALSRRRRRNHAS